MLHPFYLHFLSLVVADSIKLQTAQVHYPIQDTTLGFFVADPAAFARLHEY